MEKLFIELIYDAIKEAGNSGIPSGHLYAHVMSYMSLDTYQHLIDILKYDLKKVTEENYLLKAV